MNLVVCHLTENDCYKANQYITPKGVMVHSTGANNPSVARYVQPLDNSQYYDYLIDTLGYNRNHNDWNRSGTNACVHAFIGKFADGSVGTAQCLPWNMRGWHAGTGTSGGSANNTHISFEICEDGLYDANYFNKVYKEAVELTAKLCQDYNLNPLTDGVVICHSEGYSRGVASGHADVMHWFPIHGKSMDTFRQDVANIYSPTRVVNYTAKVINIDNLNCRSMAGTCGKLIKTYASGTVVTITKEQCGWGYTGEGWVNLSYLQKIADIKEPEPKPEIPEQGEIKEEDEDMTQEKFNEMFSVALDALLNDRTVNKWSAEARSWAESEGIIAGVSADNMGYQGLVNREQMVTFLYRLAEKLK